MLSKVYNEITYPFYYGMLVMDKLFRPLFIMYEITYPVGIKVTPCLWKALRT